MMQGKRIGRGELVIVWWKEGRFTLRTSCFVENNAVRRIMDGLPWCRTGHAGEDKKSYS